MSDHDFQLEVLAQLRDLAVGQNAICADMVAVRDHLGRLDGEVAGHERRLGDMQTEFSERRNNCPMIDSLSARLHPVEDLIVSEATAKNTNTSWLHWLWPLIWSAIGAFGLLVMLHAAAFLKIKP